MDIIPEENLQQETKLKNLNADEAETLDYLPYLLNNAIRKRTSIPVPNSFQSVILPFNQQNIYSPSQGTLNFLMNSLALLDPYSLILEVTIVNDNNNDIQIDGSAHSLIKSISVFSNGVPFETITDYDLIQLIKFDQTLSQKERLVRHKDEGFGYNQFGTNEIIIPGKNRVETKELTETHQYLNTIPNFNTLNDIEAMSPSFIKIKAFDLFSRSDLTFFNSSNIRSIPSDGITMCDVSNINAWKHVINGKCSPFGELYNTMKQKINEYTFNIPLQLKTIGFGQEIQNYKLVPLVLFNNLTFQIVFNKDAFFVPIKPLYERDYFEIRTTPKRMKFDLEAKRDYTIKNVKLKSTQYSFPNPFHSQYINNVVNGGFFIDFIDLKVVHKNHMFDQPSFEIFKSEDIIDLKAMYFIFCNDLYLYSPYARRLARYNFGLEDLKFIYNAFSIPQETSLFKKTHNSLNSDGEINCDYFYSELYDTMGLREKSVTNMLNKKNFCINNDFSHLETLKYLEDYASGQQLFPIKFNEKYNFTDEIWSNFYRDMSSYNYIINEVLPSDVEFMKRPKFTDFSKEIDKPTSKCIYAINFERTPYLTKIYKSGFCLSRALEYKIYFKLNMDTMKERYELFSNPKIGKKIYFSVYMLHETYRSQKLTGNGDFVELNI